MNPGDRGYLYALQCAAKGDRAAAAEIRGSMMPRPIDLAAGQRWRAELRPQGPIQEVRITGLALTETGLIAVSYEIRLRVPLAGKEWDPGYRVLESYFRAQFPNYV